MVPQYTLPLLKSLHLYLQNATDGELIFMITVVIHALTAQESILADLECDVSVGQVGALY